MGWFRAMSTSPVTTILGFLFTFVRVLSRFICVSGGFDTVIYFDEGTAL